ncbi:STAS domain-containing protein [Actinomadura sp. NTSP31]|uniref:STAS domain-containing protein n=1 Tax=Actinomadura sp. NTSP31 TaxID=1735447 RepID=UPI0035BF480C
MTVTPDGASSASSLASESSVSKLGAGVKQIGLWLVVEVTRELDLATAPGLLDQVGRLIALTASPCIALEMSGVTFCDSSGINAVVRLWKRIRATGGQIMVLCPRPRLAELLARTGVDSPRTSCSPRSCGTRTRSAGRRWRGCAPPGRSPPRPVPTPPR